MITKKEDLYGTHVLLSDKEAAEIYVGLINKFGISGIRLGGHSNVDAIEVHKADWCASGWDVSFTKANENGLDSGSRRLTLSDLKPRTRTEYEKVTESIFDLRDEFERGELFIKGRGAGGDFFNKITTEYELVIFASRGLYRKVEKEIDWRDEVNEWQHTKKIGIYTPLDFTVAHLISAHPDKFLELCRVALRANGELDWPPFPNLAKIS